MHGVPRVFAFAAGGRPRTFAALPDALALTPAARPLCRSRPSALRRRQSLRVRPRVRRHRPALAHRPRPRQGRRISARPLPRNHDQLEEDTFTADTPIGPVPMRNFIVRFPGKKDGVIVLATHYETNYSLRNINFVGANDGASTTGLLMAIADRLRAETRNRRQKARRLLRLAGLLRRRRGHSTAGRAPTRPTAAAIWPPSGAATERSTRSRPSSSPT